MRRSGQVTERGVPSTLVSNFPLQRVPKAAAQALWDLQGIMRIFKLRGAGYS